MKEIKWETWDEEFLNWEKETEFEQPEPEYNENGDFIGYK